MRSIFYALLLIILCVFVLEEVQAQIPAGCEPGGSKILEFEIWFVKKNVTGVYEKDCQCTTTETDPNKYVVTDSAFTMFLLENNLESLEDFHKNLETYLTDKDSVIPFEWKLQEIGIAPSTVVARGVCGDRIEYTYKYGCGPQAFCSIESGPVYYPPIGLAEDMRQARESDRQGAGKEDARQEELGDARVKFWTSDELFSIRSETGDRKIRVKATILEHARDFFGDEQLDLTGDNIELIAHLTPRNLSYRFDTSDENEPLSHFSAKLFNIVLDKPDKRIMAKLIGNDSAHYWALDQTGVLAHIEIGRKQKWAGAAYYAIEFIFKPHEDSTGLAKLIIGATSTPIASQSLMHNGQRHWYKNAGEISLISKILEVKKEPGSTISATPFTVLTHFTSGDWNRYRGDIKGIKLWKIKY